MYGYVNGLYISETIGVDLNRNYKFLWSSGIGTSSSPATEIYKGKQPSSEPEIRNVIHLINSYQNINCVMDAHSYSELTLYPWGDDENQTEDPDMNFKNPSYDGYRGHPEDSIHQEYIHKKDLEWYQATGNRIRDAIAAVRGTVYEVQPSMKLYPTSATCHDFIYSLRYNGANRLSGSNLRSQRQQILCLRYLQACSRAALYILIHANRRYCKC